ncbi:MAG: VTT domain-containing protein [Bacteroidota bacterium]
MNRLVLLFVSVFLFFLFVFGITQLMGLNMDQWVDEQMQQSTFIAAAILGISLLIADVLLPVPSSLIMIANGALFGWPAGMAFSVIGGTGAALVGYWLGLQGKAKAQQYVSEQELNRGERFFHQWGNLAVIISRPIPILAETVAVAAGICNLSTSKMGIYSLIGVLPAAFIYAWAGAYFLADPLGIAPLGLAVLAGLLIVFMERGIRLLRQKKWSS